MEDYEIDFMDSLASRGALGLLLNEAFGVPQGRAFFDDFPVWDPSITGFGRSGEKLTRVGAFTRGYVSGSTRDGLAACAGVKVAKLRIGLSELPVALVGAVATAPEHRGKGLASELVGKLLRWSSERGAVLAMLWGSEHSLYERLGFELCGQQFLIPLTRFQVGQRPASQASFSEGWVPGIFSLMKARGGGLILEKEDELWLSRQQSPGGLRWFYSGDPQAPRAYVAIGRGIDLGGIVHEWGGERENLLGLLSALAWELPEAEQMRVLGSPQICRSFGMDDRFFSGIPTEYLCMARSLDPAKFQLREAADSLWIWGLDAV